MRVKPQFFRLWWIIRLVKNLTAAIDEAKSLNSNTCPPEAPPEADSPISTNNLGGKTMQSKMEIILKI